MKRQLLWATPLLAFGAFLGVYAYRLSLLWDLGWALLLIGTYFLLSRIGFDLNYRSKYDMSVGYFLLSCMLLFGMFLAARGIAISRRTSGLAPLTFLGRNSLLFLFVHFSAIAFFSLRLQWNEEFRLFRAAPFTYWLFILLVVLTAMAVLLRAAQVKWLETTFDRIWAWIALILLIATVAAVIPHNGLVRWTEAGLGILASLYYQRLARVLKPGRPAPVS